MAWTRKHNFNEIAEYYGLVNTHTDANKRGVVTVNGITGSKHTDNGFRLRSKRPAGASSFKGISLAQSLEELPCPLDTDDRGIYWITIILTDETRWDYIGEADGETIWERLRRHFIKMAGTGDYNHTSDASGYRKFREYLKENNLEIDFNRDVTVSFNKVKQTKESKKKIHKGEGMAIESFKNIFGHYPNLNTRDETTELMEGFAS